LEIEVVRLCARECEVMLAGTFEVAKYSFSDVDMLICWFTEVSS
jgi:hypothetical protein